MASRSSYLAKHVLTPEARLPRRKLEAHRQRFLLSAVHRAQRWDPALLLVPFRPWALPLRRLEDGFPPLRRLAARKHAFCVTIWQLRKRCLCRSHPRPNGVLRRHRLRVRASVRAKMTKRRHPSRRRQVRRKSYGKIKMKMSSVGRSEEWVSTTICRQDVSRFR